MAGYSFEVRRLSGSIGAEILGIDLASEPDDNAIGEIRQVWLEHNVIFFRDQDLPPAMFLAFAKRFGEVVEYPFIKGIEGFPEIIPVIKLEPIFDRLGGLAGDRLDQLASIADKNPPVLSARCRTGEDCNRIERHPAYVELERFAFGDFGLAAISHRGALGWNEPMPPAAKYALTFLFTQSEFGPMYHDVHDGAQAPPWSISSLGGPGGHGPVL